MPSVREKSRSRSRSVFLFAALPYLPYLPYLYLPLGTQVKSLTPFHTTPFSLREEGLMPLPLPWCHPAAIAPRRILTVSATRSLHALAHRHPSALRNAPPVVSDWRTRNRGRGKKTKASVTLDELPQGLIPLEPLALEHVTKKKDYPTVVRQARSNMQKFENCVLLTRVGGFYELYFEQADEFAPLLGIKVAIKHTNAGDVSMVAGTGPPSSAPTYLLTRLASPFSSWIAISRSLFKISTDTLP